MASRQNYANVMNDCFNKSVDANVRPTSSYLVDRLLTENFMWKLGIAKLIVSVIPSN